LILKLLDAKANVIFVIWCYHLFQMYPFLIWWNTCKLHSNVIPLQSCLLHKQLTAFIINKKHIYKQLNFFSGYECLTQASSFQCFVKDGFFLLKNNLQNLLELLIIRFLRSKTAWLSIVFDSKGTLGPCFNSFPQWFLQYPPNSKYLKS